MAASIGGGALPSSSDAAAGSEGNQVCTPDKTVTLYAEKLGDQFGYGLTPDTAKVPGPTLTSYEGQCLAVKLVNNTGRRASVHAHGLDYTVASDGTPLNDGCTPPGGTRTYVFGSHKPSKRGDGTVNNGSAGYWNYHDHCMGSEHGSEGIAKGLFGALIARRAGDTVPDRPPFVVVFTDDSINLKLAPRTPVFTANLGERVEFVVIAQMNSMHTFHLHGHRWADTRTGMASEPGSGVASVDNRILGPADSFGFQVIAGENVGPGVWMYHCHVQGHADGGMSGIFLVRGPNGEVTPQMQQALDRFRTTSHSTAAGAPSR